MRIARAVLQRGVLLGEEVHLVEVERRNIARHILEELVGEGDELVQLTAAFNGTDSNHFESFKF